MQVCCSLHVHSLRGAASLHSDKVQYCSCFVCLICLTMKFYWQKLLGLVSLLINLWWKILIKVRLWYLCTVLSYGCSYLLLYFCVFNAFTGWTSLILRIEMTLVGGKDVLTVTFVLRNVVNQLLHWYTLPSYWSVICLAIQWISDFCLAHSSRKHNSSHYLIS